jgi:hypothetical protein
MDSLGLVSFKNTANCDISSETQNSESWKILNAYCSFDWSSKLNMIEGHIIIDEIAAKAPGA